MSAPWIVEQLDIIEHVAAGLLACFVNLSSDPLGFERSEEALRHGIVVAVSTPAHAGFQIVILQEGPPLIAGKLRSLI